MIPSQNKCFELLKKYNFPEEKMRHVRLVSDVAKFLGVKIKKKKPKLKVNVSLLVAAGLLHDIDKNIPKNPGEKHPVTGARVLKEEGYGEVGEVVLKHDLNAFLDPDRTPKTWEEKVLALADKMVKNEIITVDERYKLWREENIPDQNAILDATYPYLKNLEKEVFGIIKIRPEEVGEKIRILKVA